MSVPPFRWQERLYARLVRGEIPDAVDLPTGLGKTAVMAIWYLALTAGARLPRRLVYVVDRRAVVDQATTVADDIKKKSNDERLRISTLRGQYADNREWLEDPATPAIIVGTVDMIGSRLLFSGYGVSPKMRPYHAGLLGADTFVLLDESHLVPPFERLLEQIAKKPDFGPKEEADRDLIPRFRLLPLSATGRDRDGDVFRLIAEDTREDRSPVTARIRAKKRLTFEPANDAKLEKRLADVAWTLSGDGNVPVRVLIYCNSREVAGSVRDILHKRALGTVELELFVGARRVKERGRAAERLKRLGFLSGNEAPEKPAFVIATSAGEVGVDLDADHMVMDLVPFERMVQRLGRVNRLGGKDAKVVVIEEADPKLPEDMKERAWHCHLLLKRVLPRHEDGRHDASPGALKRLKDQHGKEVIQASSREPLYPALTRPLVDAWSMTSLDEHTGRPEVHPWLRGWVDDLPQTTLVWRKFLPVRVQDGVASFRDVGEFFEAAPPHLTEKLETQTYRVHQWLINHAKKLAAAIEKAEADAGTDITGDTDASDPPLLAVQKVIAIALGRSSRDAQIFTLDDLIKAGESNAEKEYLERDIKDRTLILDARMGGLSEDGLFDPNEEKAAATPDTDADWEKAIGYRVRSVTPGVENSDTEWHKPHLFDLQRDSEGNPLRQLRVEMYRDTTATEDDRSLSPGRAQFLEEHQEWTADRARELVKALGPLGDVGDAIVLAARLHDEGKKADIWQRAFSARRDGIYAKTTGPFKRNALGGYRHEFGSLRYVETNNAFGVLPEELRHLVLHLVAAHHGRARPVIESEGCEGPPSVLATRARDVALRFARLQRRFGPWGVAWLEALLRAADQQASRDLDEGRTIGGRALDPR